MRFSQMALLYLVIASGALFGIWRWAYLEALTQLETVGQASLSLASDRMVGRFERYRLLPVVLSRDQIFQQALNEGVVSDEVQNHLRRLADLSGSLHILLVNTDGEIVSDSSGNLTGNSIAARPDFRRAMNGALGFYHAQESRDIPRGFTFASPLRDQNGSILGALVVKADLESLEFHWRGEPEIIFFVDENDVIYISNRNDLILKQLCDGLCKPLNLARYGNQPVLPLDNPNVRVTNDHTIWNPGKSTNLPAQVLQVTQPLPVIGMEAFALLDLTPVVAQARLRTSLAAAVLALIGVLLWALYFRRTALARQLALREETNLELEKRVEQRTAQLRRTQDDLVHAGKLSALGQMSAGISHELNQPLAAIQSFSENAAVFLARGETDQVSGNLERISSLTTRMARIIKNLRAFARKEGELVIDVSLNKVINDVLEIAQSRITRDNISLNWQPETDIWAQGGAVRLQQVVLNLITNAMDAMEGMAGKTIWISVAQSGEQVQITVRDNGPGLEAPEQIFDPFYSTKPVSDDSMGLGLSISYGIVQSFGGAIKGENLTGGGAKFVVTLNRAKRAST